MPEPLHLSFFLPSLAGGGAERITTTLANALVERGHRVDLLLTSKHGPFTSSVDSRVSILNFERARTWSTVPSLIRVLRQRRPDVVVPALLSATVAAYAAIRWLRRWDCEVPSLCPTVHSLPAVLAETVQGLRGRLLLQIVQPVFRDVERIIAVSNTVAQNLSQYADVNPSCIEVIPNPFDVDAIQTAATAPFRHEWLEDEAPVVVAAGRLSTEKAYPDLLRALACLRTNRSVKALILGTGPDRNALDTLCRELQLNSSVAFLGFVDNPYRIMARANLLVLPSMAEAFGNVVVEALACGTPVVATTSSGGPVELLADLEANYDPLSAPTPEALADTINEALDASVNEDTLRTRAWDFDVSAIVDSYITLFRCLKT